MDIMILLTYSDCSSGIGFGCSSANIGGKKGSIKFAEQVDMDQHGRKVEKYDRSKLR
jgi:hypothetical protein